MDRLASGHNICLREEKSDSSTVQRPHFPRMGDLAVCSSPLQRSTGATATPDSSSESKSSVFEAIGSIL